MKRKDIIIKGKEVNRLVTLLNSNFNTYTFQPSENIYIFFIEKYYFRINSTLMASIIVNLKNENICEINIISGGGGQGMLDGDWGAEKNSIEKISKSIIQMCNENNWEIEIS